MKKPSEYARRILLAVTGLSPQVLTETLYALGKPDAMGDKNQPFIPTEIHILTSLPGAKIARVALLHPDGGQLHALLANYPQLGKPVFTEKNIHVISDGSGQGLADIRSPEDNANAADTITALIAELTRDPDSALHVSIAGGRKTMGFYLGYAFSLFARPQDELSHVLVSEPFENHPEFFFPPAIPRRLPSRDGQHIDTADAIVTLARIPVVRLRHGLPENLLNRSASFIETVAAIQNGLTPSILRIELGARKVYCGKNEVKLSPSLLAWMAWWARQVLDGMGAQNWRTADAGLYLDLYGKVVGRHSAAFEQAENRLANGMEKYFFQENNSKLERRLKEQLGIAASPYLLATTGKRPHTMRQLNLERKAIELIT